MRPSDNEVRETLKQALDKNKPEANFNDVWNRMGNARMFNVKKVYAIPLIVIISCMLLLVAGFASSQVFRIIDKTDYPFVNDSEVIGKWKAVDFVRNVDNFDTQNKYWDGEIFVKELVFIKDGKMLSSFWEGNGNLTNSVTTWTKGKIINNQEKTASEYIVKDINGKTYLFMQWKSGDYVFDNREPYWYVLEKIDSTDYSDFKTLAIEDKIDYPFVDDAEMLGKWQSVDFVKNVKDFVAGTKSWRDNLYLKEIEIKENGAASLNGGISDNNCWTKGLIIDKNRKTASEVITKVIDGESYMFYQWKSGDYIYRGMKPYYYVLKKVR